MTLRTLNYPNFEPLTKLIKASADSGRHGVTPSETSSIFWIRLDFYKWFQS